MLYSYVGRLRFTYEKNSNRRMTPTSRNHAAVLSFSITGRASLQPALAHYNL